MNNHVVNIDSFDDLLKAGIDCLAEKINPSDIKIGKDLVLKVQIRGERWDDTIDYYGAQYIIELQNAINRLYCESTGIEAFRDIRKYVTVKVRISKGSSVYEIYIKEPLEKMIEKIDGKSATVLIGLGILTVGGYFYAGKYLDYKKDLALSLNKANTESRTEERILDTLDKSLEIIQKLDLERPSRTLVSKLDKDDTIIFQDKKELTYVEAKRRYPKKPKVNTDSGIFDGSYKIVSIDFDKNPPEFTLELNKFQFKARAELSEQDIDTLSNSFKECFKTGKDFNVNLHLFVVYNSRTLKTASIQSLGDKRDGAKNLTDIINIWN